MASTSSREFRHKKDGKGLVHMWTGEAQIRCFCGKYQRDDPRLVIADMPNQRRLCLRCTWYEPTAEKKYNGA